MMAVRIRTTATIASARISIQVDIGFGDAITPAAIETDYPTLLDAPAPHLRAYPVETVVAEKESTFLATVQRVVGRIQVQPELAWRPGMRFNE